MKKFKTRKRRSIRRHPCCSYPLAKLFTDWKDEEPWCVNCHKYIRYGNGPGPYGSWK